MDETIDAKPLFNAASVYRTTGNFLHKREKIDQARQAYDRAYEYAVDDINVLIDRSRFCVDAFFPQQALKDAQQALSIDPENLRALRVLAAANSLMLEFEKSTTLNSSGYKRRIKPGYFREGFSNGVFCINHTIGKYAGDVMMHYLPTIRKHAVKLQDLSSTSSYELKTKTHVCRIPSTKRDLKKTSHERHRKELLSRVLAHKYLDPLAVDKFFLEELVEDPRIESANKESSKKVKELSGEALQTLTERQNVLHAQCLYYTMQCKKGKSQHQSNYKKTLLQNERNTNKMQAQQFLRKIESCINDNRINDMLRIVKNMQNFLDTKTNYNFPGKDSYIDRLYSNVGRGIFAQHRLSYTGNFQTNHRRVSFLMGLKSNRPRSYDSVIRNYPKRYGGIDEKKAALKKALMTLEETEIPNMQCWLHYEISQLQRELKNQPLAKYHAQICQKGAETIKNHFWWLNGCFSLVSSSVQEGDMNAVTNMIADAYKWSKYAGKEEDIQQFMLHCVELAQEVASGDHAFDVEKRKNEIVNVLDKGVAQETRLLFHEISKVKPGRQISVLPVARQRGLDMKPVRTKRLQGNLTIVPGPAKKLPRVSLKSLAGEVVR